MKANTMTLGIRERAARVLAETRALSEENERREAEEKREKNKRTAERITKKYLGLDVTADGDRVTVDDITLMAYARREFDGYSAEDCLRLIAPCPYCGEETFGPNMASSWTDAWAALGEQLEHFTPDSSGHISGMCGRTREGADDNTTASRPTPGQTLLAALTAYIDSVSPRYADTED